MSRSPSTITIEPEAFAALIAERDARAGTGAARAAFLRTFEFQVDPDGRLSIEERRRQAALARQERMRDLGRASGRARRERQTATTSTDSDNAGV